MKGLQVLTGILVLGCVAGLAATVLENRRLQDRVAALERAAAAKSASSEPAVTPVAPAPRTVELPSNDVARLEARIAELEVRATEASPLPASAAPTEGAPVASFVSEEFRKGVLAVLQERDAAKAAQDAERAKVWQSGMVEWQVNDLATRLALSPTQKEQIKAIFVEGWGKLSKLWSGLSGTDGAKRPDAEEIRVETEKLVADVDGKAKALLSVEQGVRYDEWRKEQNRWWQGNRGGGR